MKLSGQVIKTIPPLTPARHWGRSREEGGFILSWVGVAFAEEVTFELSLEDN